MTTTPKWPLYFRVRRRIQGRIFAATVEIIGRATWTLDFGKTWLYGVNPGAMAGGGDDLDGAWGSFTDHLTGVLSDLADEADDLEAFRRTVERFVSATDAESVAEWEAAREVVRSGSEPDVELAHEHWDLASRVEVQPVPRASSPVLSAQDLSSAASQPRIAA